MAKPMATPTTTGEIATLSTIGQSVQPQIPTPNFQLPNEAAGRTPGAKIESLVTSIPDLTRDELLRYSRHIALPEIGTVGQQRLKAGRVLCVGAGGLGSPAAMYLAAAGVGTLGLVDFDSVDLSNLQRQILHGTSDVGRSKLESARARLQEINPHVCLEPHHQALTATNAIDLVSRYDVVLDGSDNFATRYVVNDACVIAGRPNVYGSIFRFEGQAAVFAVRSGPCYRCLHPEPPPAGLVPDCAEGGVLGILPGVIGTVQATEAIKLLLGIGDPLVGRLLLYDALKMRFRELKLPKDPDCPVCGTQPIILEPKDLSGYCMPQTNSRDRASRRSCRYQRPGIESAFRSRGNAPSHRCPRAFRVRNLPSSRGCLDPVGSAAGTARPKSIASAKSSSSVKLAPVALGPRRSYGDKGLPTPGTSRAGFWRGLTRLIPPSRNTKIRLLWS